MNAGGISEAEKRQALDEILRSGTLRRAERLRQFLTFVVEEELAGRGAEIREWDIAVRALNRPAGEYTPEIDSTVRTRAHALRQKLSEYYEVEAPGADVLIELPKGGYAPRFHRRHEERNGTEVVALEPAAVPEILPPGPAVRTERVRQRWGLVAAAGFALGALMVGGVAWSLGNRAASAARDPALSEAWAPIFESKTAVRVVMSSPPQLWVRDYGTQPTPLVDPAHSVQLQDDPRLLGWYRDQIPLGTASRLYLHVNSAGALWGDAAGVVVATKFLTANGVGNELVPEKSVKGPYVFRNDSIVAFGRSEYSPLMAGRIPANGFDVMYLPAIRRHAVALKTKQEKGPHYLPTPGGRNYGLVTVLRDRADDGRLCQAMFFAGVISNGAQAGIEFMTTPRLLETLKAKLRAEGVQEWPKALQVVVRTETTEFYPMRTAYEAHLVLER